MRGSAAMCVKRLLSGPYFQDQIPREAKQDLDDYRKYRLYREDVDLIFKDHEKALRGIYLCYSYHTMNHERSGIKRISRNFFLDSWQSFLADAGIFDHTEVDRVEAKLCFLWSRMLVKDEYNRVKESTLSFTGFLEAIARLSDVFCCGSTCVALGYSSSIDENLQTCLDFMLGTIANKCKGVLKISLEGHSAHGKPAADLKRWYNPDAELEEKRKRMGVRN
jgi:hypothetical protein